MKIKLRPSNQDIKPLTCKTPFPEADHAVVVDTVCFHCGAHPFKVAGTGRRPSADDRAYEADAVALCCNRHVGTLRVEVATLFGIREDEAVARLGIRIY